MDGPTISAAKPTPVSFWGSLQDFIVSPYQNTDQTQSSKLHHGFVKFQNELLSRVLKVGSSVGTCETQSR
jgi:hypothetical protein